LTLQRAWAEFWELMQTPLRQILRQINDPIRVAAEVRERLERLPKDAEALERMVLALGMTKGDLAGCMPVAGLPDVEDEIPPDAWTRRRLGNTVGELHGPAVVLVTVLRTNTNHATDHRGW
jgi:hypothetical protein